METGPKVACDNFLKKTSTYTPVLEPRGGMGMGSSERKTKRERKETVRAVEAVASDWMNRVSRPRPRKPRSCCAHAPEETASAQTERKTPLYRIVHLRGPLPSRRGVFECVEDQDRRLNCTRVEGDARGIGLPSGVRGPHGWWEEAPLRIPAPCQSSVAELPPQGAATRKPPVAGLGPQLVD